MGIKSISLEAIALVLSTSLLIACGSGGDGDGDANNIDLPVGVINYPAPIANSGVDQYTLIGEAVSLDGSLSSSENSDTLSYSWSFLYKPVSSNATIANNDNALASFIPDVSGIYKFQLIVNDGIHDSGPAAVTVFTQSEVEIGISVPANMLASDLRVIFADTSQYLDASNSTSFIVPDAPKIATVVDSADDPIYLGLINPGAGETEILLDATTTAVALIMAYPNVVSALNTALDVYAQYISTITAMPETTAFAAVLQDQINNNPNNWQDMDATFANSYAAAIEATLVAIDAGILPTATPPSESPELVTTTSLQSTSGSTVSNKSISLPRAVLIYTDEETTEIVETLKSSNKSGISFKVARESVNTRTGITTVSLDIKNRYQRYVYINAGNLDTKPPTLLSPRLDTAGPLITTPFPSLNSDYIHAFGVNELVDNSVEVKAIGPGALVGIDAFTSEEKNLFYRASALTLMYQVALPVVSLTGSKSCPVIEDEKYKIVMDTVTKLVGDTSFHNIIDQGEWRKAGAKVTTALMANLAVPAKPVEEVKCVTKNSVNSIFKKLVKAIDIVDKVIQTTLIAKAVIDVVRSNDLETWGLNNELSDKEPNPHVSIDYTRSETNSSVFDFTIECLIYLQVGCDKVTIDYGDGTIETRTLRDELTLTHEYKTASEFTVTITVVDADAAEHKSTITVNTELLVSISVVQTITALHDGPHLEYTNTDPENSFNYSYSCDQLNDSIGDVKSETAIWLIDPGNCIGDQCLLTVIGDGIEGYYFNRVTKIAEVEVIETTPKVINRTDENVTEYVENYERFFASLNLNTGVLTGLIDGYTTISWTLNGSTSSCSKTKELTGTMN